MISVGNEVPFSQKALIEWITIISVSFTILLVVTIVALDRKKKIVERNDEWLEKNKQEIMNEVLLHERFL